MWRRRSVQNYESFAAFSRRFFDEESCNRITREMYHRRVRVRMPSLSDRELGLMRALIQPVLREQNPLDEIDRVLVDVVHGNVLDAAPTEYREALDRALASNIALAKLGPEYHPEVIVRRFLSEVRRRIGDMN